MMKKLQREGLGRRGAGEAPSDNSIYTEMGGSGEMTFKNRSAGRLMMEPPPVINLIGTGSH
jgi:hypothetical protein